jgi:hypothetical protein
MKNNLFYFLSAHSRVRTLMYGTLLCVLLFSCVKKQDRALEPAPEVLQVRPASGFVGDTVTVTGKRFLPDTAANAVAFGGRAGRVVSILADSVLRVIVPEGAISGAITVGNADASATGPVFTVIPNRNPPQIISVSSQNLETGEVLVITGSNFMPGADSAFNNVWIGRVRLPVILSTTTQITALVPPGISGSGLDLTVQVRGASGSPLKVNVSGFAGTLLYGLIPNNNLPDDKIRQFIVTLKADGGGLPVSVPVPDDSGKTKELLKFNLAGAKAYSLGTRSLFLIPTDRDTVLWRLTAPAFDRFEEVLDDPQGNPLAQTTAMAVREDDQTVYFITGGVVNQVKNKVLDFFGGGSNVEQMAAGQNDLYLLERDGAGVGSLKKIPYATGNTDEVNTTSLSVPEAGARGIAGIAYSLRTRSLYFVYETNPLLASQLYQYNEATGQVILLAEGLPSSSRFTLLDAASGPKFFGFGQGILYLINLKPNSRNLYGAVPLYRDALKLPGRSETFQVFASGELPYSGMDFLFIDKN